MPRFRLLQLEIGPSPIVLAGDQGTCFLWPPRLSIAGRSYMFCDGFIFISTRYLRDRWRQLHQTFREVVSRAGTDRHVFRFSHFCRGGAGVQKVPKNG